MDSPIYEYSSEDVRVIDGAKCRGLEICKRQVIHSYLHTRAHNRQIIPELDRWIKVTHYRRVGTRLIVSIEGVFGELPQ